LLTRPRHQSYNHELELVSNLRTQHKTLSCLRNLYGKHANMLLTSGQVSVAVSSTVGA
jgi:hypothetical protein